MQQQLQTISCHPNLSLRAKSRSQHPIIHRSSPHSIFYVLFSIFLILFSIPATAQPYQWQWAINGGSNVLSWAGASWNCYVEQVHDIAIDQNNNYYFVASISTGGTPQLNGQSVTVYGTPSTGNDILLFSTTCNGTLRWSQAIGGGQL